MAGGFFGEARVLESVETAVERQMRRAARLSLLPPDQLDADLNRIESAQPQSQRHQWQIWYVYYLFFCYDVIFS